MTNKIIDTIKRWFKKESAPPLMIEKESEKSLKKNLLKELCGDDARLYDVLSNFLYSKPLMAISKKDLDILIVEAEKSGNFKLVAEKAIFEASQNPQERERYLKLMQDLAPKTINVLEQEKQRLENEGLTDQAATLARRIENQKFINARVEDVINVASKYYKEKLVDAEEDARRQAVVKDRREGEEQDWRLEWQLKDRREAREKTKMSSAERREAEEQDEREKLVLEKRKKAREAEKRKADLEEKRIEEQEETARESRKKGGKRK